MMKHAKNLCEKNQKISGSLWSDDGRAVRNKANVGWLICYHLLRLLLLSTFLHFTLHDGLRRGSEATAKGSCAKEEEWATTFAYLPPDQIGTQFLLNDSPEFAQNCVLVLGTLLRSSLQEGELHNENARGGGRARRHL